MKKTVTIGAFLLAVCFANAQAQKDKNIITGKWQLIRLISKDKFYFNAEKDSIWVGSSVLAQIPNMAGGQEEALSSKMKQSFQNRTLQFNVDGTYIATGERLPESGTYIYNEAEKKVITKNKQTQEQKSYHLTANGELSRDKPTDGSVAVTVDFKKIAN